jgi:hypothetical protein
VKKIFTVLAIASALLLTGCGKADTAATIGDLTISQVQAQKTVDELLAERAKVDTAQMNLQSGAILNRGQLRFMIITSIFDELAKELKIEVSTAEIEKTRTGIYDQIGGESEIAKNLVAAQIAPSNFERYIRATVISNKLDGALQLSGVAAADVQAKIGELVQKKGKQMKISVNPRYGVWDDSKGDLVASDSAGSAVVPAK